MSSRLAAAALFLATLIPLALACGSEDETRYGGPAGLSGRKVQDPPGSVGTSSVGAPAPCNEAGASTAEGGTCTVSFQQTIFAKYMNASTGTWKCANTNCHGPTGTAGIPANQPAIDGANAQAAYNSLTQYALDGKPYINACTTDPSGSGMDCNLQGSCEEKMPTTGSGVSGAAATPAEITDVETWLQCGAPFN